MNKILMSECIMLKFNLSISLSIKRCVIIYCMYFFFSNLIKFLKRSAANIVYTGTLYILDMKQHNSKKEMYSYTK